MTKTLPVFKRELKAYFNSPIVYVIMTLFLIIAGIFFGIILANYVNWSEQYLMARGRYPDAPAPDINQHLFGGLLVNLSVVLLFLLPFITMRLFSDEKKSGTAELLFSYPVKDSEVLLGKFLASGFVYALMLAMTLIMPFIIAMHGGALSWQTLGAGYLGLLLAGLAYLSLGLFYSSLTENQIIAASLSLVTLLALWVIKFLGAAAGDQIGALINYISIITHQDNFMKGIIDTGDVAYYLGFIFLGLFLTLRSLESRRWRA